MNYRPTKKLFIVIAGIVFVVGVTIFSLIINAAGEARYARLSIDALGLVLYQYHKQYLTYPADLKDLSRFYAVSVFENFYLDSSNLKKKGRRGYYYDFSRLNADRFVLSASPVWLWPGRYEFGITEKGILRSNDVSIDSAADIYEEVESWKAVPRLLGKDKQSLKPAAPNLDENNATPYN